MSTHGRLRRFEIETDGKILSAWAWHGLTQVNRSPGFADLMQLNEKLGAGWYS
jgi:hypothetical protein